MVRTPGDVIRAFAQQIAARDIRAFETYLDDSIDATFDEAGSLPGRRAVVAFWRRLFQTYPVCEMHLIRLIEEGAMVIAEGVYILGGTRGPLMSVRAISLFEIEGERILRWTDHADLGDVPASERQKWRRLASARW